MHLLNERILADDIYKALVAFTIARKWVHEKVGVPFDADAEERERKRQEALEQMRLEEERVAAELQRKIMEDSTYSESRPTTEGGSHPSRPGTVTNGECGDTENAKNFDDFLNMSISCRKPTNSDHIPIVCLAYFENILVA